MVQDARKITYVIGFACGCFIRELIHGDKVFVVQFPQIHTQFTCGAIHQAFKDINRLGAARTAIGVHLRGVRIISLHTQIGGLHIIGAH